MDKAIEDRNVFLRHLPGKVASINELLTISRDSPATEIALDPISLILDEIEASASALGFVVLLRNVVALKECLDAMESVTGHEKVDETRQFLHLLDVIKREVFLLKREHFQAQANLAASEPSDTRGRSLYILDTRMAARTTYESIERYGYRSARFSTLDKFLAGFSNNRPDGVVVDSKTAEQILASDSDLFEQFKQFEIPVVFTSEDDDFVARHNAAWVDAIGFMLEPYKEEDIAETFDRFFSQPTKGPFRVLLVEDTSFHIDYITRILEGANMQVESVSDPFDALDRLEQFAPEIILMDLYMPKCDGIELAKIIRQYPNYLSIPIVYLSVEESIDKKLDAMKVGCDDFITKSIRSQQLVYAVKNRILRYRSLCRMLICDGLTGLLNHTKMKETLAQEVARASRYGGVFSYAMIDIDNFKEVNDSFGHAAGDQVLKTLAQLLKGRFRGSDVVGRYGGEEFAVILHSAGLNDALRILDDLRECFAQLTHSYNNHEFKVTFSGGVASYPDVEDVRALGETADKALYQAKNSGRNRICAG